MSTPQCIRGLFSAAPGGHPAGASLSPVCGIRCSGRSVVEDKVDARAISAVRHLVEHQVIELEGVMRARRHTLGTDDELDIRIRHQGNMYAVTRGKGRVRILVHCNTAAGPEPSHHGTQYLPSRGVVSSQHLI